MFESAAEDAGENVVLRGFPLVENTQNSSIFDVQ
jgi:hypothetical protein